MEQKSKTYIRPIVIVMIFVFLTIGYAYLTSALNINGTTLLKKPTWDVHFENVQVKDGSVTGDQVTQEPEIDTEQTTVSFHVNLKKPGDYYEFTVDAVNAGTIDAMINTYTEFDLTEDQLKYLETSVTYEDGEEIQEKQQLLAGDFAVYKIVVSFKKDISEDDLPSVPDQLDLTYSVEYVQKDNTAIERSAETYSLYNVLKKEVEGGLVRKYNGEHQDNIDASLSKKDIYHWYASNATNATIIKDKWNVIFANHCWQMIRTTDTGGIRLLYNGEVVDGKCLDNRANHYGFSTAQTMGYMYNIDYSDSFVFDSASGTFSLSGNISHFSYADANLDDVYDTFGKYTCANSTCSKMYFMLPYKAQRISSNTFASNFTSQGAPYYTIGAVPLNKYSSTINSTTDASLFNTFSYMYGDEYPIRKINDSINGIYTKEFFDYDLLANIGQRFYYSSDYSYNSSTGNYSLVNPILFTSDMDISVLDGKYSFYSNDENRSSSIIRYIFGTKDDVLFARKSNTGTDFDKYYISNNIEFDNSTNKYNLINPQLFSFDNYKNNLNIYNTYYICQDGSNSCEDPLFIYKSENLRIFTYYKYNDYIYISKQRNGNNMINPIRVRLYDLLYNNSDYSDYVYTCGKNIDSCSTETMSRIVKIDKEKIIYTSNYFFGNSISYINNKFVLNDYINLDEFSSGTSKNHHYFCITNGVYECDEVGYIIYYGEGDAYYYITLSPSDRNINDAFNNMHTKNINDSLGKIAIDSWYKNHLLSYSEYLEPDIFCNNRKIRSIGSLDPDNGSLKSLPSFGYASTFFDSEDLYCPVLTDRFSVNNPQAKLTYSIGLPSASELNLLGNGNLRRAGDEYMVDGVYYFHYKASSKYVYTRSYNVSSTGGSIDSSSSFSWVGNNIRPMIALKSGVYFSSGDGSMANPYVIDTD